MKFIFDEIEKKVKIKDISEKEQEIIKEYINKKFKNYDKNSKKALFLSFLQTKIKFDIEEKENKIIFSSKEKYEHLLNQ